MTVSRPHPHLVVEREAGVVTVRVDREEALGALSRGILEALSAVEAELAADRDVRVVVLTGTGKGFIAGADIGEYDGVGQEAFDEYQRLGRAVFDGWAALPAYTIAAVNGWALGGGFELALCCDEIMAVERARFGLPEVKLGLIPGGGGSQRLARALGTRFAKRLIATGEFVAATELHRRGLVSEIAADADALAAAVRSHATTVAGNAPLAVRAGKRVVDAGVGLSLADGLAAEQSALSALYATTDAREGIAAFLEKRAADFEGR